MTARPVEAVDAAASDAEAARRARDLLVRAVDLTRRHGFSQGCFARFPDGDIASWRSPRACRFCAVGFLLRAASDLWGLEDWRYDDTDRYPYPASDPAALTAFRAATRTVEEVVAEWSGHGSIAFFNDDPDVGKEDVRALFAVAAKAIGAPVPRRAARPAGTGAPCGVPRL
jgi:hypothetical protein